MPTPIIDQAIELGGRVELFCCISCLELDLTLKSKIPFLPSKTLCRQPQTFNRWDNFESSSQKCTNWEMQNIETWDYPKFEPRPPDPTLSFATHQWWRRHNDSQQSNTVLVLSL